MDVTLVDDHVEGFGKPGGAKFSECDYVKAFIFVFKDVKHCFSRGPWFSDDIEINKGANSEMKIGNPDDDWEEGGKRITSIRVR